ncbi:S8 family serine peptidase [Hymenobacter latericus]|uniref:S8 family serine peptidase n=1 Tax=Hymenobacter sp. YIM 151858-1 TaxID=2987688 RepID=UPI002226BFD2|nr:S8 family serine peptidase [Hymenobacter sp. YIM 151858-1]UYZ59544.1 S8 family serine peptidase [Hymenobacter sp. YIM 151858-1]
MKNNLFHVAAITTTCLGLLFTTGCNKHEVAPASTTAQASNAAATSGASAFVRRAHQYIILSATDKLPADLQGKTASANGQLTAELPEIGLATATSTDPEFASKAAKIEGVRSVIHDFSYQGYNPQPRTLDADASAAAAGTALGSTNPFFALQWGFEAMQVPQAWSKGARGQNVRVAVLDGGFDLQHPDLQANIVASRSFVPTEPTQFMGMAFSHGTHTAGTVAAVDNNRGVVGVAPDAKLILVKVLNDNGSGSFSWMINGIYYAVAQQADVINLSLGAAVPRNNRYLDDNGTPDNPADDALVNETREIQELLVAIGKATSYARQQGVTVIAAAGNDANDGNKDGNLVNVPATSPGVISISATAPMGWANNLPGTNLDRMAAYTNYGTADVTFAAPGGDYSYPTNELVNFRGFRSNVWAFDMVLSTNRAGGYTWSAGTSMAAPHAAGVAALIIGQHGGQLAPAQVEAALRASADDLGKPGRDPYYGYGRLNALRAVSPVQ